MPPTQRNVYFASVIEQVFFVKSVCADFDGLGLLGVRQPPVGKQSSSGSRKFWFIMEALVWMLAVSVWQLTSCMVEQATVT